MYFQYLVLKDEEKDPKSKVTYLEASNMEQIHIHTLLQFLLDQVLTSLQSEFLLILSQSHKKRIIIQCMHTTTVLN